MDLGIVEIILLTSLVNSIFFLLLVLFTPSRYSPANLALTLFIFLTSLNFASWIILPYWVSDYEWICLDRFPVVFFLGPLLYVFSNALFRSNFKVSKLKTYFAGYLDVSLTIALWIYIYFFSLEDKFEILYDLPTLHSYEALAVVFNAYYVYKSIKLFHGGNINQPQLKHVFIIIVVIFFLWISTFLGDLAVYPSQVPDSTFYPLWILMVYLNFYLAYHFILNPAKSITYMTSKTKPSSAKTIDLASRLEQVMSENKLFREADLNLSLLASEVGVGSSLLSKVLKEHFKSTYYDFINKYRIQDTIVRFKNGDDRQFTIKTIAEEAGFRSKTTFIKAFKKETGMLPKDFISSLHAEESSAKR